MFQVTWIFHGFVEPAVIGYCTFIVIERFRLVVTDTYSNSNICFIYIRKIHGENYTMMEMLQ